MDSFFTYMLFSILDVIVISALTLKLYRLPLRGYKFELIVLSVVLAVFSYIMRVYLDLTAWDLPLQYVISVLFYCRILRYRRHYAAFIVGSGMSAYLMIQVLIYFALEPLGVVDESVIFAHTGLAVNPIQLGSHTYSERSNLMIVISGLISAVILCLSLLILLSQNYLLTLLLSTVTFAIAYYFSYRADYESFKGVIEKKSQKAGKKVMLTATSEKREESHHG